MAKFKGIYRIESTRKPGWDYGGNGFYFVTICIKDKVKLFGKVKSSKMELSKDGLIANKCWLEIPDHFPFVKLHAHIIMPEHLHGIIEIAKIINRETKPPNTPGQRQRSFLDDGIHNNDIRHPKTYVEKQKIVSLTRLQNTDTVQNDDPIDRKNDSPTAAHNQPCPHKNDSDQNKNVSPHPQSNNPFKFTPQNKIHKAKLGPQSQNLGSIIRGFKIGVTKHIRKIKPEFSWQRSYYDIIIRDQKSFRNISRYIINNPKNYKD